MAEADVLGWLGVLGGGGGLETRLQGWLSWLGGLLNWLLGSGEELLGQAGGVDSSGSKPCGGLRGVEGADARAGWSGWRGLLGGTEGGGALSGGSKSFFTGASRGGRGCRCNRLRAGSCMVSCKQKASAKARSRAAMPLLIMVCDKARS